MEDNELALAFAKEVMGWEDATIGESQELIWGLSHRVESPSRQKGFWDKDASAILGAVQEWRAKHDATLVIRCRNHQNGVWSVRVEKVYDGEYHTVSFGSNDLPKNIMQVAVKAERLRIENERQAAL